MKKPNIKTRVTKEYLLVCSKCKKEIVGKNEKEVLYNFNTHYDAKHGE